MQIKRHALPDISSGTVRELHSFHYGTPGLGRKVYIQSSLHADEIPGMLVNHYLREMLEQYENRAAIAAEIVLVPVANPIGLAQEVQGMAFGRFDLATGINFNRGYRHLTPRILPLLEDRLGADAKENVKLIRQQALAVLQAWQPETATEQQKKILQTLAVDADLVLDLHCDNQAVMHLYTGTPLAQDCMPLAAYLGAQAVLVSVLSGDDPFDESCSRHWWELAQHFGQTTPVPNACLAITIELRGETEVSHELARADASSIIHFLQHAGYLRGKAPSLPAAVCQPTPLEGVEPLRAPHAGILVFTKAAGEHVEAGERVADIVDPVSAQVTPVLATVSGILFARVARRYATHGMRIAKIAGPVAYRSGNLLSL
ncbi:succinylglutamate desuccinylase/aspartoacylase family protein [Undibacterium sp. TS12]|uniref:succinylglutamate desuccinylase/aspartoacylase family protein n=1 Tax=Undibacterium sp. TS12 TaxID=2908202 RepID=UPI001F4D0732|nr:succinylglutamate desuccinylase/aspartoacylase family protein [Undibacterium sp. TS12]MCH8622598.1 M14 family metallopeptidase [Undibacterium sp. TS12]